MRVQPFEAYAKAVEISPVEAKLNLELSYLGGILDGEGSVSFIIHKRPNGDRYGALRLSMGNTDERIFNKAFQIIQKLSVTPISHIWIKRGKGKDGCNRKPIHYLVANGKVAFRILEIIEPYTVRIKLPQPPIGVDLCSTESLPPRKCLRCNYKWIPRKTKSHFCPKCRSPRYNQPELSKRKCIFCNYIWTPVKNVKGHCPHCGKSNCYIELT